MSVQFTILAGGSGTRLWPLSRANCPKQFIVTSNGKTLLENTIDRIMPMAMNDQVITLVAPQQYKKQLQKINVGHQYKLLIEPESNNTGAAVVRTALEFANEKLDPVLVFLPADHIVEKSDVFRAVLMQAIAYATQHPSICLLGCLPTKPTSAYGYARVRKGLMPPLSIRSFYEKPSMEGAQALIASGDVYWNSGIFVAKASVILAESEKRSRRLFNALKAEHAGAINLTVPSISFDKAVIEKSDCLQLFPLDCGWSDVGLIDEFLGKVCVQNNVIQVDSTGTQAFSKNNKPVVFSGVSDVCVIETDDVIFVVNTKKKANVALLQGSIRDKQPQLL